MQIRRRYRPPFRDYPEGDLWITASKVKPATRAPTGRPAPRAMRPHAAPSPTPASCRVRPSRQPLVRRQKASPGVRA
jgi:hypothetical protein